MFSYRIVSYRIIYGCSTPGGNAQGKWNSIFRSNRGNQEEWLLAFLILFPNPYISEEKGNESVCEKWGGKSWSEYSERNKWTTSRGDLEYSSGKKPKQTFPFDFQQNFLESLASRAPPVMSFSTMWWGGGKRV